jgi:hypothetical protein
VQDTAHDRFARALQALKTKEAEETPLAVEGAVGGEEPTELIEVDTEVKEVASKPESASPNSSFLQSPTTHPLVLDLLLLREYGPEWYEWDPDTLHWVLLQDFAGGVSDLNLHKLQALRTLHTVDHPWTEWEVFVWCAMPLTGVTPDFEVMQCPTASQTLVALDIFNKVRRDVAWSTEVKTFLGVAWKLDGLVCTIPPADIIEVEAEDLPVDCAEVTKRWPDVKNSNKAPTGSTVEDEQLRRLLDAYQALLEDRALFDQQVKVALR